MGVLADAVNQVVEFAPDEIEAPPSFGTPIRVDYLQGLGKLGGEFVLILDTDRVLSSGELAAVDAAARGGRVVTVAARRAAHAPLEAGERIREISEREFALFQTLILRDAGIFLAPAKKALLVGRLSKRLRALGPDDLRRVLHAHRGRGRPRRAHPDAGLHQHERDALLPRAAAVRVSRART